MKKRFLNIFIIVIMIFAPCLMASLFIDTSSDIAKAEEDKIAISSLADIGDYTKSYLLNGDITIEYDTFIPIGTQEDPFTGVFDGNGNKITIKNVPAVDPDDPDALADPVAFKYQGIFGYAKGATFKNVHIVCDIDLSIDLSFNADVDEYYFGTLLGKGEKVTIEECEVENAFTEGVASTIFVKTESKLTFGGLVGALVSNSTIQNCGAYLNYDIECDLTNRYTIKVGGLVGDLNESTMCLCVGYNDGRVSNKSVSTSVEANIGGLIGNISESVTQVYNSASTSYFTTETKKDDTSNIGGIVGAITNPKPNPENISSCGYYFEENSVPGINFYGNTNIVAYEYKNSLTKDYIISIPEGIMSVEKFFREDDCNSCGMVWHAYKFDWDFDSIWIISDDKAKLQQFQKFDIMLVSDLADPKPLDDSFDCLEDISKDKYQKTTDTILNSLKTYYVYDGATESYVKVENPKPENISAYYESKKTYSYGEEVVFELQFKRDAEGIDQYQGYYEIIDIYRDGENLNLSKFSEEVSSKIEETVTTITTSKTSKDNNFKLDIIKTSYNDTNESSIKFVLTVKAGYSTKGSYSFVITEVPYFAYIVAESGGYVTASASISSTEYTHIQLKSLTKNKSRDVRAISAYQHVFDSWSVWYEISKEEYVEAVGEKTQGENYLEYKFVDSENNQEIVSYWKKNLDLTENMINTFASDDYKITFGNYPFTQNFMFRASFVKKTYSFNISNFDLDSLNKVEVVYNTNQVYTFDENSTGKDYIELDQNEIITLKVYLKNGYSINEDVFPSKLKVDLVDKGTYNINGESGNVYSFSIATSSLKELVNGQNQYGLELIAFESGENEAGGMPLWLLIVIIGGGALIIMGVVVLIVKLARRNKAPKEKNSQSYKSNF